jgi:hypothetical protein
MDPDPGGPKDADPADPDLDPQHCEEHSFMLYVLLDHAVIIKLTKKQEGGFGDGGIRGGQIGEGGCEASYSLLKPNLRNI